MNNDDIDPEEDELQERAEEVLAQVKEFWLGIAITTFVVVAIVTFFAYSTYGVAGVIAITALVLLGLYLLGQYLLTF